MNPVDIILKKRDGQAISREELSFFINGYLTGSIPEYQVASFLMAVVHSDMTFPETAMLTEIMMRSGKIADLSAIPGIKVDKHSTGGVGDKVSLILAPMVAACGVPVPMVSGRGLGHTGGTLDKLESIPGFRAALDLDEYAAVLRETGLVMIGQTAEIAPADRKLYALRDVTGTVESIPLIASSIMSKKLAEGIDALVMDVKTGLGAFMTDREDAIALARTIISVGRQFGKQVVGYLTDMNQPLGYAVGNWNEVAESVRCLKGENVPDVMEVTYTLGGAMVMLGKKAGSMKKGMELCRASISSGRAYEAFLRMVRRQGGDTVFLEHPERYPASRYTRIVASPNSGYLGRLDAREVGLISGMLGAGRTRIDERIDPKAGIVLRKKIGDRVERGDELASLFTDNEVVLAEASKRVLSAVSIVPDPPTAPPLIHGMIDESGDTGLLSSRG